MRKRSIKMKVDKEMVEKKTWKEFRDAGFS